MATSMQFGPEWMRKAPNSKPGAKDSSTTTSSATSPASGPVAGNSNSSSNHANASAAPNSGSTTGGKAENGSQGGKRHGHASGGLGNLSGPAPVVSPAVSSPGAFSFAAAAAAATAQNSSDRNGHHGSSFSSTHSYDHDASATLLANGAAGGLSKDKLSREKLLSLYSSDRASKVSSAEPSPIEPIGSAAAAPERSSSTSRRKGGGSDRRPSAFSEFNSLGMGSGGGGGGPLSPGLGGISEPRGLNARSTSGGSSGGFGSAGTSNWDRADKERPGLFQRASSGAVGGIVASSTSGSRPLSPSVSRDRFGGIQGGVLSGVAPPSRSRMDSSDGGTGAGAGSTALSSAAAASSGPAPTGSDPIRSARGARGSNDENATPTLSNGPWVRAGNTVGNGAFSEAFSSNRARSKGNAGTDSVTSPTTATAAAASASGSIDVAAAPSTSSNPIVPSGNPEGLSISARFARYKDRLPGEGPIGPPSDGSIGFGKSSSTGFDRRRERGQTGHSKVGTALALDPPDSLKSPSGRDDTGAGASAAQGEQLESQDGLAVGQVSEDDNAQAGDTSLGNNDYSDLAQQASAVLGSLKLDDDDSPTFSRAADLPADDRQGNNVELSFAQQQQHAPQFPPHQPQQPQHFPPQAFSQSNLAPPQWSPENSFWLYRDMAGNVQGPFSSLLMQDWYSQRYFADDLLIKRQEDADFKPLAQVVSAIGNALSPFVVPPTGWLHSPDAQKSRFDRAMGEAPLGVGSGGPAGAEQDRFGGAFDGNRPWQQGPDVRNQQWPAQLNLGGLNNGMGPQPMSPFGRPDPFGPSQGGLDGRLRSQDEIFSMMREREMHEQRQAAASRGPGMGLGQLDAFGGVLGGGAGSTSNWGLPNGGLGQFDSSGFGGHQSPLVGDRPGFDAFGGPRPGLEQVGSPWAANRGAATPRSQFEHAAPSPFGGPRAAAHGPGQWSEQQQQQQQPQTPWSYHAMTPDTPSRQLHDFVEGFPASRSEAIKSSADPIGTPRRARSPAPQGDVGAAETASKSLDNQNKEQQRSFESAFPGPATGVEQPEQHQNNDANHHSAQTQPPVAEAASASTPAKKSKKDQQKQHPQGKETPMAGAAAVGKASQPTPSTSSPTADIDVPPPEAFNAGEPRPEEIWPQSPKAVEFASEPELSGMADLSLPAANKAGKDAKREQRSALHRQSAEAARGASAAAMSGEQQASQRGTRPGVATPTQTGAGNVRVVSQEQFRRGKEQDVSSSAHQAPLSSWLSDASGTEGPGSAAASKPAPWAAREDAAPTSSPGPSLREIQEAEARRAEARRAAEKAAVRARMVTSPSGSGSEELPTTLSWGLASAPASKNAVSLGDGSATGSGTSATPAAPVWNAGKAAPKKTLMEIQQEEQKRAEKLKAQQAAQAIAMRKGYADSAGRSASGPLHGALSTPSSGAAAAGAGGGAWSVVGASGKPNTPAAAPAPVPASPSVVRPTLSATPRTVSVGTIPSAASTVSAPSSAGGAGAWSVVGGKSTSANGSALPASPAGAARIVSQPSSSISTASRASAGAAVPQDPNAPSAEFVRYLKDNMKGLTIKPDDFIEMLMSFPLNPDEEMMAVIADTVYSYSSTLDGRRFAADFVAKRKMDVQASSAGSVSRWGSASTASGGGMGSFGIGMGGDLFKSASSTAAGGAAAASSKPESDMGGFKVVKGKNAKKRT
ncbi:hypothetical protein BCV70DRAFT_158536 [Testicularia cyperi]|uniref:GYF domain-containing protein n=1 Tax=Testicularia cyperi TaxID=1882483 RepID=A0A317XTV0_9BASI|nr:hypothetical protein BCV70DRAFT_158536 [Testicularia cyperi]